MSITVSGLIEQNARYYHGPGGQALLAFQVHAAFGLPFEVGVRFGERAEDHIRAQRAAQRVRKGSTCEVTGDSIGHRTDHSFAVYQLGRLSRCVVDGEEPIDLLATAGVQQ